MSGTHEERPAVVQPSIPTIDPILSKKQAVALKKQIARLERKQKKSQAQRRTWIRKLQAQIDYSLDVTPRIKAVREIDSECFNVRAANGTENQFLSLATQNGWTLTKRGWPDFLGYKNGRIICVEVKQRHAQPRKNQSAVLAALSYCGIPCYVWRPKRGFQKIPKPTTKELDALMHEALPPI